MWMSFLSFGQVIGFYDSLNIGNRKRNDRTYMIKSAIKKLYYGFIPYSIRVKIIELKKYGKNKKYRKEIEVHEVQFMNRISDLDFDDTGYNDKIRIFRILKKNGYNMYPDMAKSLHKQYFARRQIIRKDRDTGLLYIWIDGKKLFYKRGLDRGTIQNMFNGISFEQDFASPHRYLSTNNYIIGVIPREKTDIMDFSVNEGDVVIDAGAAEGNFAFSVADKASKIYLVESDPMWCEALRQTFLPYKDKVEIVQKNLSDLDDPDNTTLKGLLKEYKIDKVDFLKMDIEGYETRALRGGIIDDFQFVNIEKMALCVYHNLEDEREISNFVQNFKYDFYLTEGYLVASDLNGCPIRKAVLRAYK